MLNCKRDRLDYGELLQPPDGYILDRGIAATYSADLKTLLSIPVALVYSQTLEGDLSGARFQLLDAIKRISKKVKVYHQKGQLHVPNKFNWLYAYLEDMLVPILPKNAYTAFHPKLWVLRYKSEQNPYIKYRVIVLSRNLTFDRNWDVAVFLEGELEENPQERNQPLVDFVRWLQKKETFEDAELFINDLKHIFFKVQGPFENFAFHPIGIPEYKKNPVSEQKANKALVISPFLHWEAVQTLINNTVKKVQVFSERTELQQLPIDLFKQFNAYCLSDTVIDGEYAEEGDQEIKVQHLHGKLFLFEKKSNTKLFIGSANATKAALEKNVEFLLELNGSSAKTSIITLCRELLGPDKGVGPFVEFTPAKSEQENEEENRKRAFIRRFEYALLSAGIKGRLESAENPNNFNLALEFNLEKVPTNLKLNLTVKPFNVDSQAQDLLLGEVQKMLFPNISEVNISRFLHFRIEEDDQLLHEFLLCIKISGIPKSRMENIFKKIINNQDKFFEYLRFLLVDEITKEDLLLTAENDRTQSSSEDDHFYGLHLDMPIYEQLLVTASRSPQKLKEIDELIGYLHTSEDNSKVIPDEFLSFWDVFRSAIPNSKERADA
ncbi:phospholipase D family protein [Candidatus Latescibacterota bacterium]